MDVIEYTKKRPNLNRISIAKKYVIRGRFFDFVYTSVSCRLTNHDLSLKFESMCIYKFLHSPDVEKILKFLSTTMADKVQDVEAALQTISQAPIEMLLVNIRQLCEANYAIAKAICSLSLSFYEETGQFKPQFDSIGNCASAQAKPPPISEINNTQGSDQVTLHQYRSRHGLPEHAVVRLAQYWIKKRLAGTSLLNIVDENRALDDLRKAVVSSTPVFLALIRSMKKRRSATSSRR